MAQVHPDMYFYAEGQVTSLAFSDKNVLFVGTEKGQIQKWSLQSQTMVQKSSPFDDKPILWMKIMDQNKLLVQARFCKSIKILDFELQTIHQIEAEDSAVHFCKGDAIQREFCCWTLAVAINESNCQIIEYESKTECIQSSNVIKANNSSNGLLGALKLTAKEILILGYENGTISLINTSDFSVLSTTNLTHSILSLDFDSTKNILISSNTEDYLSTHQLDLKTGQLTLVKNRTIPSKGISSVKIRKDGKVLAAGSWDSTLRLFSWLKSNLKPLGALKFHEKAIESIDVTSELIAAGSSDGYVTIWNVYNQKQQ